MQKPWSCIPTLNHGYWEVETGLGLNGQLIKFRYSEVMESIFYYPKDRAKTFPQLSRKEKGIGTMIEMFF